MSSTFSRALLGFVTLSLALTIFCTVGLWATDKYIGPVWWISGLIVLLGMCTQLSIYATTLHDPIKQWIREPAEKARQARDDAQEEKREAARQVARKS